MYYQLRLRGCIKVINLTVFTQRYLPNRPRYYCSFFLFNLLLIIRRQTSARVLFLNALFSCSILFLYMVSEPRAWSFLVEVSLSTEWKALEGAQNTADPISLLRRSIAWSLRSESSNLDLNSSRWRIRGLRREPHTESWRSIIVHSLNLGILSDWLENY